jgi:hypothetical protein
MFAFDAIAERRIAEAIGRGELDDLPGAGRALDLDDDRLIPEDLRLAFRILRNAGFVPPEVTQLREIAELERAVLDAPEGPARARAWRKLELVRARRSARGQGGSLVEEERYYARILEKLGSP